MNNKKKKEILITIKKALLAVSVPIIMSGCASEKDGEKPKYESNDTTSKIESVVSEVELPKESTSKVELPQSAVSPTPVPTLEPTPTSVPVNEKEVEVINHFNKGLEDLKNSFSTGIDIGLTKGKELYTSAVDFLFNDKEIGGITFDELSDSAKETFFGIVSSIDETIMKVDPDYKETVIGWTKEIGDTFMSLVNSAKTNASTFIKENIPEDVLNAFKNTASLAGDLIQEEFGEGNNVFDYIEGEYEEAKDIVKDWFQR